MAGQGLERREVLRILLVSNRNGDAAALLEEGRRQFPDDPSIALTLGRCDEVAGTFSEGASRSVWVERSADERQYLTKAEGNYRSVLPSANPPPGTENGWNRKRGVRVVYLAPRRIATAILESAVP